MTVQARQPHVMRGARLLALLLAVLLSVTSLTGHAAMEACTSDCMTAQVEMVENADHECSVCAALVAIGVIASTSLDTQVDASGLAVVDYIPLPPRPPPRT